MSLPHPYDLQLTIDGTTYGFITADDEGVRQFQESLAPSLAPQVRDTAFGYEHADPLIDVVQAFEDWSDGAGFESADEDNYRKRYSYSNSIDLSWPGRAYCSPRQQSVGGTNATDVTKIIRTTLGHFAIGGRYIYYYNGSTWPQSLDAGVNRSFTDIIEYSNGDGVYLIAALAGGSIKERYYYAGPVISHRDTQTASVASDTSVTVTAPTGLADDDILLAFIGIENPETITPPAGFTSIASIDDTTGRVQAFYKRAASESGNYDFTWTTAGPAQASISAYSGCVTSGSPVDTSATSEETVNTTTHDVPALTAITGRNRMLVAAYRIAAATTWTAPTDYTERADVAQTETLGVADKAHAFGPAAATTATSGASERSGVFHIALLPDTALTWTQSTLLDASVSFKKFVIRGVTSDVPVLWGITEFGEIRNSTDPSNAGSWSAADQIGMGHEIVNGMAVLNDTIYVLKRNGIWTYDGTTISNVWLANDLVLNDNGSQYLVWSDNRLYTNYGNRLLGIDDGDPVIIGQVFPHPDAVGHSRVAGQVNAMAATVDHIYFSLYNSVADATYIMKGRPTSRAWHTWAYWGGAENNAMLAVPAGTAGDGEQIHASNPTILIGRDDTPAINFYVLPRDGLRPEDDSNYRFGVVSGTMNGYGSFVDWGARAYQKFLTRAELVTDDATATETIRLGYQLPGGTDTAILTTSTTADLHTTDITTEVLLNTARWTLQLATGAQTTSPIILGFALHANAIIPRRRLWRARVVLGDNLRLRSGAIDRQSAETLRDTLFAAVDEYITLIDGYQTSHNVRLLDIQGAGMVPVDQGGKIRHMMGYDLVLIGLTTVS